MTVFRKTSIAKEIEDLIRGSVERFVSAKNIKDQPQISMQVKPRQSWVVFHQGSSPFLP